MVSRLAFGACVGAFLPQVAAKTETCSGLTCDADGESWLSCRLWLLLLVLGVTVASVSGNARIPSPAGGRFPTPIEVSFCGTHGQSTKVNKFGYGACVLVTICEETLKKYKWETGAIKLYYLVIETVFGEIREDPHLEVVPLQ